MPTVTVPAGHVVALVDVRAMYASCEQVFDPTLRHKPVVVLSNNDGCVIARTAEAKRLGIRMGQPWFTIRDNPHLQAHVIAKSSNYALYGDMSARFITILAEHAHQVCPYSIDEAFILLPTRHTQQQARRITDTIDRWLGLPVTIGIGATKTLAKIGSHHAKNHHSGVCDLTTATADQHRTLLADTSVGDVWGIGARLSTRLGGHGIHTAAQLAHTDPTWIRTTFNITVERTVRELSGTPLPAVS